ncbi:MAG: TRAP transporter small permease subunit [Alphaproteobacteria bacterium]
MIASTGTTHDWEVSKLDLFYRLISLTTVSIGFLFLFNNYLIFWRGWPGIINLFATKGWFSLEELQKPLTSEAINLGWLQLSSYILVIIIVITYIYFTRDDYLRSDAKKLSSLSAYIIRSAFWAVLIIGLTDSIISFLRVEDLLDSVVGDNMAKNLGISRYRGTYIHYPIIGLSFIIAYFIKSLGFTWLAILVVLAEFQIVIVRFIFSYEQAFLGDLVRFWYAALFLFASAYTLIEEGHVRVDVLYAGFSARRKALVNALGSLLLGIPLCWIILALGMWGKATIINSPLLAFEMTQSGFGLYVKYLMAGFLAVYAITMMIQFASYFLSNIAIFRNEPNQISIEN